MRQYLRHIKFIDLKFSKIDKEKSDPKKGLFVFLEKRYINYKDASRRPDYKIKWQRNHPYDISALIPVGWSFVELSDPFVPQGAILNSEKHWVFEDAILMKIKLETFLDLREEAILRSQRAVKARQKQFEQEVRSAGGEPLKEEEIAKLVGEPK